MSIHHLEHRLIYPGGFFIGHGDIILKTLLGSCVGVAFWNEKLKAGGLCHYLLSHPKPNVKLDPKVVEGKYGSCVLPHFLSCIKQNKGNPADFKCFIYGGADTLGIGDIGQKNIEYAFEFLSEHNFDIQDVDVGDNVARTVRIDMRNGHVENSRSKLLETKILKHSNKANEGDKQKLAASLRSVNNTKATSGGVEYF